MKEVINQEDTSSFGRLTFCPESPRRSPLVLAARQGHLNVVQYFLDNFADIININYQTSVVSQKDNKNEHSATALLAATLGSHIEVIKLLVSRGADVNKSSLTGCTPLQAASEIGNVDIMRFLIESGAGVNQPNLLGRSPLCTAAAENCLEAMEFLLRSGANSAQVDIHCHTAMHVAADRGHNRIITALLQFGVSPMFAVANPRDKDYVPCPLFLAAANGRLHTVTLFTDRDDCPEACKSDVILLLAMQNVSHKPIPSFDEIKTKLELGLKIREEGDVSVIYPEPHKAFDYRQEIKTQEELRALWGTPEFMSTGLYYQRLLVEERCIGIQKGMTVAMKAYLDITLRLFQFGATKYYETETLLVYVIESIVLHNERLLSVLQQGFFEEMMKFLAKILIWVVKSAVRFVNGGHPPQFHRYLDFLDRILSLISAINAAQCHGSVKISNWKFVTCALRLYSLWLSSIESETDKSKRNEHMTACRALGEKFVANHLYVDQTTLLHLELVRVDLSLTDLKYLSSDQYILLSDSLLKWGADAAINMMDSFGRRPIHCVKGWLLFQLFVSYGAHPDAVNSFGGSAYDALNFDGNCQVPLSLACYAARKIVSEKIPYLVLDLPSAVQNYIQLHDKDHTTPMLERGRYHHKDVVYTI